MKVGNIISNRQPVFKGWSSNKYFNNKLNNEKKLNALADEAKVDIRTYKCQDNKFLPGHDMYLTTSFKKLKGRNYFATDCLITEKNTPDEKLSKSLFASAEKSIGKLYGKLAQFAAESEMARNSIVSDPLNKKIFNLFKNFIKK